MRELLIKLMSVSLLCGMIEMLTPAGEREGLRRGVRLLTGLFLLSVMLTPLARADPRAWLREWGEWARAAEREAEQELEARMTEKLTAGTLAQLQEEIYDLLERRMAVAREDCTVMMETAQGAEGIELVHIRISLRSKAVMKDPRQIESLIEETVGCACTVSWG